VPCDGLAFLLLFFLLDIKTAKTPIIDGLKAVDWVGSVTFVGGTIMFLLGLEYGGVTYPWASATVICLIIFGILTWVLFLFNEWKLAKYAITPIQIFHPLSNLASFGVCFLHGFAILPAFFFLPIYFQAVLGASPILSGVYLLPLVLSIAFGSVGVGILIRKTGRYLEPLRISLLIMTLGIGLLIDLPAKADWAKIIIFQIILGLGTGPNFLAPLIALQTLVARKDIATATATFTFVRQLATSISVVIGGVIFQNQMQRHGRELLAAGVSPQFVYQLTRGNAVSATLLVRDLPPAQRAAVRNAYTESLQKMWILFVCIGALGFLTSLGIEKRELKKEHETMETGLEAQERYRLEEVAKKQTEKQHNAGIDSNQKQEV
jgi:Major Facilitator Superfamily